jgi:hypothetical protein
MRLQLVEVSHAPAGLVFDREPASRIIRTGFIRLLLRFAENSGTPVPARHFLW